MLFFPFDLKDGGFLFFADDNLTDVRRATIGSESKDQTICSLVVSHSLGNMESVSNCCVGEKCSDGGRVLSNTLDRSCPLTGLIVLGNINLKIA